METRFYITDGVEDCSSIISIERNKRERQRARVREGETAYLVADRKVPVVLGPECPPVRDNAVLVGLPKKARAAKAFSLARGGAGLETLAAGGDKARR